MNQLFADDNTRERERLVRLVDTITDEQLALALYKEGWTIAVALAHLAFCDERRRVLLRQWQKDGVKEPHSDMNTINDALIPFFRALPPRTAANLAVTTAGAIDRELKDISPELVADVKANGDIRAMNRSLHRKTHLDDIEVLINAQR